MSFSISTNSDSFLLFLDEVIMQISPRLKDVSNGACIQVLRVPDGSGLSLDTTRRYLMTNSTDQQFAAVCRVKAS